MRTYGLHLTRDWKSMPSINIFNWRTLSFLFLLSLTTTVAKAQVVINEIYPTGTVELKNIGTSTVDVSSYWLCDFPAYQQISNSNVICGNTMLGPGEILAVDDFNTIASNDGEMGLYTSASFGSSSAIIDYVEWGSTGHQRSSVAVAAGIWTTGDFVPAFASNESIAYSGMGNSSSDWTASATTTICSENMGGSTCMAEGGNITLTNGDIQTSICVDGNADPLDVVFSINPSGTSTGWIITDDLNNILALPQAPPFDLDGAGIGTCIIWHIAYEPNSGFGGNTVGNNLSDLTGCFDLSNGIVVIREAADGGMVSLLDGTNSTSICVDGNADPLEVVHTTMAPNLTYDYVITDENNTILAFAAEGPIDLDGAGVGVCRIWGWSYRGLNQNDFIGLPLSDLQAADCSDISDNFIEVIREEADGGTVSLANGMNSTSICVDGNADPLEVVHTTMAPNLTYDYVITDDNNTILAFAADGPIDLDGAGIGICRIWGWSYRGLNQNDFIGLPLSDLQAADCSDISDNFIEVIREAADGGMVSLTNGNTTYTGTAGNIVIDVQHTTNAPNLSYWYIITDDNDNILDFMNSANGNTLNLSGAPEGVCHVWGWSYRGLPNPVVGENISTLDDDDCEDISSNFITVIRQANTNCDVFVNDISLADGTVSTSICVDGNADPLTVITNGGTPNVSTGWIITDDLGNILALPPGGPFDLDGAGVGTCEIWYIRYEMGSGFGGNTVGNNLTDLTGCFALSNPITVIREAADGGMVSLADGTNSTSICVDGNADPLEVSHTTMAPNLTYDYVITDDNNTILAFAAEGPIDLDGAGVGVCRIWGWSYRGLNQNDFVGLPLSDLQAADCSDISDNFIEVIREAADGGMVSLADGTNSTSICVDGNADPLEVVHTTMAPNLTYDYVITDDNNNILAFAAEGPIDLDGAGVGVCRIWGWSYRGLNQNDFIGLPLSDLQAADCSDISDNFIEVIREAADGGMVSLVDGTNSTSICVDGNADPLEVVHTTMAPNLTYDYVITDDNNTILAFAASGPIDLDGAGVGTCRIWGWSYRGLNQNDFLGLPLSDLQAADCSDISDNFIEVIREAADGGMVSLADGTNSTSICVDGNADPLEVVHTTMAPNLTYDYVITDDNNTILAFAASGPIDLDGAGVGVCRIWGWSYRGLNQNDFVGLPLSDLQAADCSDISDNFIEVIREAADGGMVSLADGTNSTSICVDGNADPLEVVHTTMAPNLTYDYVITDENNNILAFAADGPIDLDGAGVGVCRIWGWSYRGLDQNDFIGLPLSDLQAADCSDISDNFIEVIREAADGGMVSLADGTNSISICVDGIADPLEVIHTTMAPNLTYDYVITDDDNTILAFAEEGPIDLDGAGVGTCRIWGWSYRGLNQNDFIGLPLSDLQAADCSDISDNFIEVIREAANGGTVALDNGATSVVICIDGNPDPLTVTHITSSPNLTYRYVITDDNNTILAFSNSNSIDLEGAGLGICRIWGWNYRGLDQNDFIGLPLADLQAADCSDISDNFIEVIREAADGGIVLFADGTTTYTGTVGSVFPEVQHFTDAPNLSYWYIITDEDDTILGYHNSANGSFIDLGNAPAGTCRIWGWSYRGLPNPVIGDPISTLTDDACEEISENFITVIREDNGDCDIFVNNITLADGSTSTSICVDGNADPLDIITNGGTPDAVTGWIITDDQGNILGLPQAPPFDLDGAGTGTCQIWYLRYEMGSGFGGNMVGNNLSDLTGCFAISNPVTVIREEPDGGMVALLDGTTTYTGTAGNIMVQVQHTTNAPNLSYWYIITDDNDNILGFLNSANGNTLDLSGAPAGTCRIWGWSYRGLANPVLGESILTLTDDDCEDISDNFITVIREQGGDVCNAPDFIDEFTSLGQYGDSKYYLSNNISRPTDAQALAESLGGYLVTISSAEENDFIQQNISELVYIGLNDYETEGTLEWFSGEPVVFENFATCAGCEVNADNQDFVVIAPWDGGWSFSNFFAQRRFIIEIPCGVITTPTLSIDCSDDLIYTVAAGETMTINWDEPTVSSTCPDNGIDLVQIDGVMPGTVVSAGTYQITYEAADNCGNIETCTFIVIIEEELDNGDCLEEIDGFTYLGEYNNSSYFLSDDISRPTDAQALAESYGGFLVTINSQEENDFIQAQIPELVYIGLNDYNTEGTLEWFSGEPVVFENFATCAGCEVNADNQDFVVIAPWDGGWSFSNFFAQRRFVIEVPCSSNNSFNADEQEFSSLELESRSQEVTMEKIMPNPAMDFVNVVVQSQVEMGVDIQIYDSRGSLIMSEKASLIEGFNDIQLDINTLPGGFYQINIPMRNGKQTSLRFVKIDK